MKFRCEGYQRGRTPDVTAARIRFAVVTIDRCWPPAGTETSFKFGHQTGILLKHRKRRREIIMRTTLNIDDELVAKARRITGVEDTTALVNEGLRALIERESTSRLATLGGSQPQLRPVRRQRR
jgi:Arc/MetJ family transcription regulator